MLHWIMSIKNYEYKRGVIYCVYAYLWNYDRSIASFWSRYLTSRWYTIYDEWSISNYRFVLWYLASKAHTYFSSLR